MALGNFESKKIYLSVNDGAVVRTFKEANANTVQRINKKGNTVHEQKFKDITGVILSMEKRKHDFGTDLVLAIKDGEDEYQLQMPFSSRYTTSFLKALPNINLEEKVKMQPWTMQDKNNPTKKVTGLTCYQNDGNGFVKIAPFYTKEDPKGLPQMEQITFKGETHWDDSKMLSFLFDAAQNCFQATSPASPSVSSLPEDAPF